MSSKETKRLVGRLRTATNRWSTPAIGALRNFRWKIARADTGDAASGTRHSVIDLPPVPEAATQTRPSPVCSARPRAHAQLQPRGKYAPACVLATTTLAVYSRPERCTGSRWTPSSRFSSRRQIGPIHREMSRSSCARFGSTLNWRIFYNNSGIL